MVHFTAAVSGGKENPQIMSGTSANPPMPVINLDHVKFRWRRDDDDILNIAGLQVTAGEQVFIKGASGSCKTTLLSLLGGVITPRSGTVSILNTAINELSGVRRDAFRADHIGFIFQMFNLIPYLPLVENVTLPCQFSAVRRQRAIERSGSPAQEARRLLMHLELNVDGLATRPVTELSVGQQQRVAAARALIGAPAVIIADEPTSSLDTDARGFFLDLLFQEARAAGSTLMFVSHDTALERYFGRALALADINQAAES
jgi:putative ABC transport system ATP-binding protein